MVVATAAARACVQAPLRDLRHPRRIVASLTSTFTGWIGQHGAYAVFAVMAVDALLAVGGELSMLVAGAVGTGAIAGLHPVLLGHDLRTGLRACVAATLAGLAFWCFAYAGAGWALGSGRGSVHRALGCVEVVAVAVVLAGGALHGRRVRA